VASRPLWRLLQHKAGGRTNHHWSQRIEKCLWQQAQNLHLKVRGHSNNTWHQYSYSDSCQSKWITPDTLDFFNFKCNVTQGEVGTAQCIQMSHGISGVLKLAKKVSHIIWMAPYKTNLKSRFFLSFTHSLLTEKLCLNFFPLLHFYSFLLHSFNLSLSLSLSLSYLFPCPLTVSFSLNTSPNLHQNIWNWISNA